MKIVKLPRSGPISWLRRGWSSPRIKNMHMTAARLNAIETQEPSKMPVITVSGRIREYYALRTEKYPLQQFFDECTLDRKPYDI